MPTAYRERTMDALTLRLLGPMQVHVDGVPVAIGGPRRRSLLAYLVVHRETPVPAERIIAELWGPDAEDGARHSLQTYVSALRRLLEHPTCPVTITHDASGYRLVTSGMTIDVDRFEAAAARALQDGDPLAAAEAVRLWAGEPLQDLPTQPWSDPVVVAWHEQHRRAAIIHVDAELDAGRHDDALDVVDTLLRTAPFDEALWVRRMLALYRAGRQTQALAAFDSLRKVLLELGLEPGPEATGLHRRILLHDPAIAGPGDPPHIVPASISSFVGRSSELGHLNGLLRDHRLITVTGPGGVGKTRTALELAHAWRGRLPDGVVFVDLVGVHDGYGLAREIASRLPNGHRGGDAHVSLTEVFDGAATLLVLDNAEHLRSEVAATVVALLRRAVGLRIVVTSRVALGVTGEVTWQLPPLDLPHEHDTPERVASRDAVQLFIHRAREVRPAFRLDAANRASVAAICCRLDGLPLAIEIAASRMRSAAVSDVQVRLEQGLGSMRSTDPTVADRHRTLSAVLHWSTDPLAPATVRLFARLAVVPGAFDRAAAASVCPAVVGGIEPAVVGGIEPAVVGGIDEHLDVLVAHSLLEVDTSGQRTRYRMLEVVREHAAELLDARGERPEAERALLGWGLALVRDARIGMSGPEEPGWVTRVAADRAGLRAALDAGLTHDPVLGIRLATRLVRFWWANAGDHDVQGSTELPTLHEGIRWLRRLLAVDIEDARARAGGETALGFLLDVTGEHDEALALLVGVRDRMDTAGQVRIAGWACLYAANAAWGRGDPGVLPRYREALDRLERAGDREGQATAAVLEFGYALHRIGPEAARPARERFLALTAGADSSSSEVYRAAVCATDALACDDPERARPWLARALARARSSSDPATTSMLFGLSAWFAAMTGEIPAAARWLAASELAESRHGLDFPAAGLYQDRGEEALGASSTAEVRAAGWREARAASGAELIAEMRRMLTDEPAEERLVVP
jgi:predicted ATPase/DNA-binding SARP family transcriptional activator